MEAKSDEIKEQDMRTDLYISSIPPKWTSKNLKDFFAKFNPLHAHILMGQNNGFLNFANNKDAISALIEYNGQKPNGSALPLCVKFARKSVQKHDNFWKKSLNKYGRMKSQRDLNKLQELILNYPHNPVYHYEYSCALAALLDSHEKIEQNPNLVPLWLNHINIAIDLSKQPSKFNKPTYAWVKRKITFCIRLYKTNENCHNIDIEDLLEVTWNAVSNYNRYYFYLLYLRVLYVTQREELVTESLKLYEKVWIGNERHRYFQSYLDYKDFVECMIRNGCNLDKIMQIMDTCWKYYYAKYGFNVVEYEKQHPEQKGATFAMYLMVVLYVEHICFEHHWKVNNKIISQCVKWLQVIIELRPNYMQSYIELSFCYFCVFNDYLKCRNILEKCIQINCEQLLNDGLKRISKKSTKGIEFPIKWKMFVKWIESKVLSNMNDYKQDQDETPMMGDGGMIEPGSKLNVSLI